MLHGQRRDHMPPHVLVAPESMREHHPRTGRRTGEHDVVPDADIHPAILTWVVRRVASRNGEYGSGVTGTRCVTPTPARCCAKSSSETPMWYECRSLQRYTKSAQ